jgi:flagellar hook-basal body complex protein FliE
MSSISFGGFPNVSVPSTSGVDSSLDAGGAGFGDILKNAVNTVDTLHSDAASQVSNVLQGGGADMNDVMIAVEKADVSFQLMMQVRNKIVSAYQDIEKMQF